ncbi:hypothetical protein ACWIG3_27075 [Streptomyces celluloflavus]|uniref:Uncharacterized protein n=1 Tax=Streptomyces celluloflavus TaxID=58344 RepID=A0ABW7RFN3_9ACTN
MAARRHSWTATSSNSVKSTEGTLTAAQTLLKVAESAVADHVTAALAALAPIPADTTRSQLSTAMRNASNAPALTSEHARLQDVLGTRDTPAPRAELGETDTRIYVWSVRELDAAYARVARTITARQADRSSSNSSHSTTIEIPLTVAALHRTV